MGLVVETRRNELSTLAIRKPNMASPNMLGQRARNVLGYNG